MPDFGTWIGWHSTGDFEEWYRELDRSDSVAFMIGHRGISITLDRAGTPVSAQTLLLAPAGKNTTASEISSDTGVAAKEQLLLVGLPTADIKRQDRFKYPSSAGRLNYEVVRVERSIPGMIQAFAEEMQ